MKMNKDQDPMTSIYVWKCICGHYECEHRASLDEHELGKCENCDCEAWEE